MEKTGNWTVRLTGETLPDRSLIGGKAWSIARMLSLGLPAPPAFVVTTSACNAFMEAGALPPGLEDEILESVGYLESSTGRRFGGPTRPLLVSVRSGAPISMPGMMDTVLNLGIAEATEKALGAECGDAGFARNTHRRFYDLYSTIVLKAAGVEFPETESTADWNKRVAEACGAMMPTGVEERLIEAVKAVFESWNSRRARRYREHHNIAHHLGTAVTVQAMVFGNLDERSGTGVLFSRNPLTGEPAPYGEYLRRAQGEDVVSGKHTPENLDVMKAVSPDAHDALMKAAALLERENGDMQDIEFTVERGKLFLLQSRTGKRAPAAAVRIAVDMTNEGLIDEETAVRRVTPEQIRALLAPRLANGAAEKATAIARGEGACPGVALGLIVTDADRAEALAASGQDVILARPTTSPEDVHGIIAAKGVITETGGSTSHAAVVSRALGRPCVVGCGAETLAGLDGRMVTIDGGAGLVFDGPLDVVAPREEDDPRIVALIKWAASRSALRIFRPGEAPSEGLIDLSAIEGGEEPSRVGSLIAGKRGAMGGAIASDEGVRAALEAGLEIIVADPILPALLVAAQACGSEDQEAR